MKTITLVKIGAIGGLLTTSMGFALQYKLNNNIKQTTFFKESMTLVRHNKAAIYFLGEPIKDSTIETLDNTINYIKDDTGKYEVKLRGSKESGRLHIYIERDAGGDEADWKLKRLELAIDNQPDKRLLIKTDVQNQNDSLVS